MGWILWGMTRDNFVVDFGWLFWGGVFVCASGLHIWATTGYVVCFFCLVIDIVVFD